MARPCECDRPGCRLCHLYATRADYRAMWDRATTWTRKPPRPPCVHLGDEPVNGGRLVALGLSPLRDWRECGHPSTPLGPVVCRCRGCGPKCSGYSVTATGDSRATA